jgi:hypothetical protein
MQEVLEGEMAEVMKDWDGFISPDGSFYATRPTGEFEHNGIEDCHEQFAYLYLNDNGLLHKVQDTCKDALVKLNWICCTFGITSRSPWLRQMKFYDIMGPGNPPTQAQIETIREILSLRRINPEEVKGNVLSEYMY